MRCASTSGDDDSEIDQDDGVLATSVWTALRWVTRVDGYLTHEHELNASGGVWEQLTSCPVTQVTPHVKYIGFVLLGRDEYGQCMGVTWVDALMQLSEEEPTWHDRSSSLRLISTTSSLNF